MENPFALFPLPQWGPTFLYPTDFAWAMVSICHMQKGNADLFVCCSGATFAIYCPVIGDPLLLLAYSPRTRDRAGLRESPPFTPLFTTLFRPLGVRIPPRLATPQFASSFFTGRSWFVCGVDTLFPGLSFAPFISGSTPFPRFSRLFFYSQLVFATCIFSRTVCICARCHARF